MNGSMYIHGVLRLYATWSFLSRGVSYLDMTGVCQGRKKDPFVNMLYSRKRLLVLA